MTTRYFLALIVFIFSLIFLSGVFSSASAADGKTLYQKCIVCHGDIGQGNTQLKTPSLAGQFDWYLVRQLNHFKQDIRGGNSLDIYGEPMKVFAMELTTQEEIDSVAKYIVSLEASKIPSDIKGDLMNGSRYYQAKCGACHGGKAQGNAAFNAPKLANQHIEYLQRQMKNYREGVRGTDARDKFGKQMAMMSKVVSEKELKDILFYISKQ